MMSKKQLNGIFVPTVTPFSADEEVDPASYRRYVDRLLGQDIQGLVVGGTTGESPTVEWDEVASLVRLTQEAVREKGKRMPVVVGTGTNNTASSVRRTEAAGLLGADAVLVVVPYYSRPSQEGILAHFRHVSQVGVPVIVYEIPSRTGTRLSVDTARRIMDLDGVIGMKDSTGDTSLLEALTRTSSKPMLCGEDRCFFDMLSKGARGGILASANIRTEVFVDVYRRFERGDAEGAVQAFATVLPWIERLFREPNPAPVKWLLAREGIIASDALRLPMSPISQSLREELETLLRAQ
ncbi:4-hydroxy-tetrahydrodipicolinate synthase [Cohnella sp. OV330]|uniref:4-hydroxy-tetrahydrodipicolinate synthase n=1 Tax=Cohnella sp. OV330 TaxID=1855288 RepID=UPI0008E7905F|nr:4-hydroxy-tetrahydrodipicolinate synthase [Cohnella sp. OV330]SFB49423.1 4-hydroxy-tetrahydrodipicolinate synthase [Cohnella sp. OV330]